jgi:hypothetical protein
MKVTLERADIISLLGKAMGRTLSEKNVEIHIEPFEVIIHDATNILVPDDGRDALAAIESVRLGSQHQAPPEDDPLTIEELAAANQRLAARPPRVGRRAADDKKPRAKMVGEVDEPRKPVDPLLGGDDE